MRVWVYMCVGEVGVGECCVGVNVIINANKLMQTNI